MARLDGCKVFKIFAEADKINLKPATGEEIVKLLERYNLSDTSEDVKGIAFERFLGRTFRGEIGQFFTPRTIVEFMVEIMRKGFRMCEVGVKYYSRTSGVSTMASPSVILEIFREMWRYYRRIKSE